MADRDLNMHIAEIEKDIVILDAPTEDTKRIYPKDKIIKQFTKFLDSKSLMLVPSIKSIHKGAIILNDVIGIMTSFRIDEKDVVYAKIKPIKISYVEMIKAYNVRIAGFSRQLKNNAVSDYKVIALVLQPK